MVSVQPAGEPPPPTLPQPQGTNPPSEAELANLDALRAAALEAEALEADAPGPETEEV